MNRYAQHGWLNMDIKYGKRHLYFGVALTAATACIVVTNYLGGSGKHGMFSPGFTPQSQNLSTDTSHQTNEGEYSVYDILHITPKITFNDAFKNPCWVGKAGNGPLNDGRVHCLPYFYILGVKKSGTSDLYARIANHPDFVYPGFKESQWLTHIRFNGTLRRESMKAILRRNTLDISSVSFYISMFDRAASLISSKRDETDYAPYFRKITGDATPANMHIHNRWDKLPGNEDLAEPKYTNFHYLKQLTPDVRIILIYRDPVSRLYSDFKYTIKQPRKGNISGAFHDQSVILIQTYEDCFRVYSMRHCLYNNTLAMELTKKGVVNGQSFRAGFYEFYMREIYEVFDQDEVLPLLMTEYTGDMKSTLTQVFDFLQMRKLSSREWERILNTHISNKAIIHDSGMFEKTHVLLKNFYSRFNEQMATLMKDKRYLFK